MNETEQLIFKQRWWILFTVVMMTFMACLDGSIVNVALPVMRIKLHETMASITLVVTSYLIVISATIVVFGRLGDIKGKTKVFKFGIILFTIGSLLCGISSSLLMLVIARVVQAIGAASFMSNSQGIITHVFPQNERGRALGVLGTFVALGMMFGPPLGGIITHAFKWNYIFLINVPIGIITLYLSIKIFPPNGKPLNEKLDLKGAVLFAIFIITLFVGILCGQDVGFGNPFVILAILISMIGIALFILLQKRTENPLIDLKIFNDNIFSTSLLCGFISFVALSCSNIIQPFYLQDVMKLSSRDAGLYLMVFPLVLAGVAPLSGYLSDKIGSEVLTCVGLVLTSIGLFLMASLTEESNLMVMVFYICIMSIGNGMFQSPNNSLVMSTVPRNKLGIAGSINALVRNLGMVVGIAFSTTLLYLLMSFKLGKHVVGYVAGRDDVFIFGMKYVYIVAGGICLIGAGLTAFRLYGNRESNL